MAQHHDWHRHFETRMQETVGTLREPTLRAVRHALRSGKRLRPLLARACFLACDGGLDERSPGLIDCAIAVELIHKASLAQDDLPCMDADDARDGIPTLHVAFSASDAVLASDAMIALAFRLVAHLPEGAGCVAIVSDAVLDMCRGQADDLSLGSDAGASAWAETCDAKTGAMFVAAAKLGVVASGLPSESLIDNARGLGMAFGRLYQLRDDAADGDGSDADMRAIEADAYERLYASVGSFPAPAALESFGAVVRTSATAAAG